MNNENCEICFQIICKRCGWKATGDDIHAIASGELTACPVCGWRPNSQDETALS